MTIGFLIMTIFFLQGDQVSDNWRTKVCVCRYPCYWANMASLCFPYNSEEMEIDFSY